MTDSDLWETGVVIALLGCLWLVVWRRMSIRSAQRRQFRHSPPPEEDRHPSPEDTGHITEQSQDPSPALERLVPENSSGPPVAGQGSQEAQQTQSLAIITTDKDTLDGDKLIRGTDHDSGSRRLACGEASIQLSEIRLSERNLCLEDNTWRSAARCSRQLPCCDSRKVCSEAPELIQGLYC